MSWMLNNINPRVPGCLKGMVSSIEQLVKLGLRVEKDCMGMKDYWQKVGAQHNKELKKRATE